MIFKKLGRNSGNLGEIWLNLCDFHNLRGKLRKFGGFWGIFNKLRGKLGKFGGIKEIWGKTGFLRNSGEHTQNSGDTGCPALKLHAFIKTV